MPPIKAVVPTSPKPFQPLRIPTVVVPAVPEVAPVVPTAAPALAPKPATITPATPEFTPEEPGYHNPLRIAGRKDH